MSPENGCAQGSSRCCASTSRGLCSRACGWRVSGVTPAVTRCGRGLVGQTPGVTPAAPAAVCGDTPQFRRRQSRWHVVECVGDKPARPPRPASRWPRGRGGRPCAHPSPLSYDQVAERGPVRVPVSDAWFSCAVRSGGSCGVVCGPGAWSWGVVRGSGRGAGSPGGLAVLPRSCAGTRLLPLAVGGQRPECPGSDQAQTAGGVGGTLGRALPPSLGLFSGVETRVDCS